MTDRARILVAGATHADTLTYRELGEGAPVILINGYAATKDDWDPTFAGGLASASRVICPDNRGMGASPPSRTSLTIGDMADDVIALMESLSLERTDVIGWSMGGFITQEVAARVPERVRRVVLLSTDCGGPDAVRAESGTWARLIDHSGSPREQARRVISLLFPDDVSGRIDAEFGDVVAQARAALSPAALDIQEHAIDRWHEEPAAKRLRGIRAPALIAAGAQDVVIPAANVAVLAGALPGAQHELFDRCGHAFMAQLPDKLAALINEFLDR